MLPHEATLPEDAQNTQDHSGRLNLTRLVLHPRLDLLGRLATRSCRLTEADDLCVPKVNLSRN